MTTDYELVEKLAEERYYTREAWKVYLDVARNSENPKTVRVEMLQHADACEKRLFAIETRLARMAPRLVPTTMLAMQMSPRFLGW